jgi:hypothetical protein
MVYTMNQTPQGKRYKVISVERGHSQTYEIDYDETFAPGEVAQNEKIFIWSYAVIKGMI